MKKFFGLLFVLSCSLFLSAQSVSISSPVAGATVGTHVHFIASASGGNYPVTAIRIYIDNKSAYTTSSSRINTYLQLATGGHYVVVRAWNSAGRGFSRSLSIRVIGGGSVTVSAPGNGATLDSPVQFVASATSNAGASIAAMRIYVDSNSVYGVYASSLNVSLPMSGGSHSVFVLAWDNTGKVYLKSLTVTVNSPNNGAYQSNVAATGDWISQSSIAPDGAILYGASRITPYYSNIAAIGMTKNSANYGQIQNWMQWYINHLNWPDKWGLYGTTYDYTYDNGVEASLNDADSTDSYAATFLSLAWAYFATGDANAQAYVRGIAYQLDVIGGVLIQTQQSDGLTWAKPDYQIKYLMDNCEAYRGLRDLALLFQYAFNDGQKQQYYTAAADNMLNGIQGMWMGGNWAVYKDDVDNLAAPNMGIWYPDATSQMFPILEQVLPTSDGRVAQSYASFNSAWPDWPNLSFNSQDPFPWVLVGSAAALMGDSGRAGTYINSIQNRYVNNGFPWNWYSAEAGWFMRLNNYMQGNRSF